MRLRGCLSPDPKEKLLLMRTTEEQNNCQTCPAGGFKTMCGGQALIEGIMMRGPKKQAIVVRKPDGELAVKESQLKFIKDRYPVLGLPLVRGVVTFCASMVEGVKALMFSAEFYPEDEEAEPEEPSKFELWLEKRLGSEKMASLVVTLAVILGIGMSIGLFFLLPTLLGTAVTVVTDSMLVRNVAESLLKLAIFVGYLALCSRMKDIHRVFEYHGAEQSSATRPACPSRWRTCAGSPGTTPGAGPASSLWSSPSPSSCPPSSLPSGRSTTRCCGFWPTCSCSPSSWG